MKMRITSWRRTISNDPTRRRTIPDHSTRRRTTPISSTKHRFTICFHCLCFPLLFRFLKSSGSSSTLLFYFLFPLFLYLLFLCQFAFIFFPLVIEFDTAFRTCPISLWYNFKRRKKTSRMKTQITIITQQKISSFGT